MDFCADVSERVFARVMQQMQAHHLILEGCLLKPNMVTPGSEWAGAKPTAGEIAWATVRTLSRTMVPAVAGVTFLSGGQSEEEASVNLNAMNMITEIARPWNLSFSFGRALQASVLKTWAGKSEHVVAAQAVLLERAAANGAATKGEYKGGKGDTGSMHVANYVY